jgi:integrase
VRQLGVPFNQSRSGYKLNFTMLMQPWLRQAAKRYIRYNLTIHSVADCQNKLKALNIFSAFTLKRAPTLQPSDVDRALIVDFLSYLSSSGSTEETRKKHLLSLRTFFEVCAREGWSALPEKRLIYEEDLPHPQKILPRFIPQEVLDQLNQHVDTLPPHVMRMVLILQECGMRISELCTMRFECLTQDAAGDWFLCSFQGKMKKEHRIPISREVVAVIQEQQKVVRNQWGPDMPLLFPTTRGLPFKQGTFLDALNRLAYHKQIRDATGKVYRFQSHQFRHTVGTRMINSGVPQHIVQRYLGHESPEMTARYTHIHDQTMKEEYMKFRGRVVDVTGKVIEQSGEVNGGDAQWIKKNILAQALPNGKCALPVVAGDCPHANACLTCVHFRTDASFLPQHQAQLQETQRLIQIARSNGWKRQAEMNEKVEANLKRIITALEGSSHDI